MVKIAERRSRFGTITILKDSRRGALLYSQGGYHQSEVDANGVSLLYYVHALIGLLRQARPERVLIIGCAGGTLATALAKDGVAVTAVDINPHAFRLARDYFGLPASVECRLADGYEFLISTRRTFDAIVLDAFHGDIIPDHLKARAFFKAACAHLARNGILLANVHMANDDDPAADRMAAQMAFAFRHVRVLDRKGRKHRNVILMAGSVRGLKRPALLERPAADSRYITNAFRDMRFRPRKRALALTR
jgi:spermidine synthase